MIASISRLAYVSTCSLVGQVFDSLATGYQERAVAGGKTAESDPVVRSLLDRFSVLVYIIGALIGSRPAVSSSEESDAADGELVEKVLQLIYANQALSQRGKQYADERLDTAFVYFFHQFRKSYVGDVTLRNSKVFDRLAQSFQLNTVPMVLNVIVQKLATNLKLWADEQLIVDKSLSLLSEISSGYSSVKLLRKTETASYILANHTPQYFPFLSSRVNVRSRIIWYSALGRLLASSDDSPEADFEEFIAPFTLVLEELMQLNDIETFKSDRVRLALDGLMRDLRGLLSSFQSKKQYMLFFDWFYPYCDVLIKGIQANHDNKGVMVSVLRFFSEFVQNKSQRLSFDVSSPGGILLFRETSKVICATGSLLLGKSCPEAKKWPELYKPISLCLYVLAKLTPFPSNILRWSLVGKYVNFGVFELYNDQAYHDAMSMYFQLLVQIPVEDLMTYPKLTQSSIMLFQVFSSEQMLAMKDMDSQVFQYMMRLCSEGLSSSESGICSQVAISIDYCFSFIVKQKLLANAADSSGRPSRWRSTRDKQRPGEFLLARMSENPSIVTFIMNKLLDLVLFEDHPSQWTFTRALLPLVLANKEFYDYYVDVLVSAQLPDRQAAVKKAITGVMEDIELSLHSRNRDRFTQQMLGFRREITSQFITLIQPQK
ncbi:MAG: hypothetical protein SGCHY_004365 [Lobulomycetales sp.]